MKKNLDYVAMLAALNRKIKLLYPREQKLVVGSVAIKLPPHHALPTYLSAHQQYDRFLPRLAGLLPTQTTVIDVGANCGDSLAAMISASSNMHYICIEPDDDFFKYLTSNVALIKQAHPDASITTVRALIGQKVKWALLAGDNGTKKAIKYALDDQEANDGNNSIALDEVTRIYGRSRVSLIKSDVDGFDYDVINSASETIRKDKPLIFFECQLDTENQKVCFENLFLSLNDAGYTYLAFFDNFGAFITVLNKIEPVRELLDYVWRQNMKLSTRTIYYYDVLAISPDYISVAAEAIRLHCGSVQPSNSLFN